MKCSKCNYISFDHNENCPKCKKDLTEIRAKMNLPSFCPIMPAHTNFQDQGTEGSIKIEQTGEFTSEENMDVQFADSQDFESSFDAAINDGGDESDLDFALATDTDELTLDFDEFSIDDSDTPDNELGQETITAGDLEDELNLSFADDTDDIMSDFDEVSPDDDGKSTLDAVDFSTDDTDIVQSAVESVEDVEEEPSDITLDFEEPISLDEEDEAPTRPESLEIDLDIPDDNSA